MKKIFLLFPIFALCCSCGQTPKTTAPCRQSTIACESEKKFMALKIISVPKNVEAIDAYGDSLITGKWYLRSNITHILFPIGVKDPNQSMEIGSDQLELKCYPILDAKTIAIERIMISTGDAGIPGQLQIAAEVLVNKNGQFRLDESDKIVRPQVDPY